jgi:hypothetical protein
MKKRSHGLIYLGRADKTTISTYDRNIYDLMGNGGCGGKLLPQELWGSVIKRIPLPDIGPQYSEGIQQKPTYNEPDHKQLRIFQNRDRYLALYNGGWQAKKDFTDDEMNLILGSLTHVLSETLGVRLKYKLIKSEKDIEKYLGCYRPGGSHLRV